MTENRRIALNVVATYGRTIFSIACGLFAGRWTLMSLGEVDYGLYGVVGGLAGFISFLNDLMAAAVGRFYAYSVGQAKVAGGEGVEICRKWFNTALVVHTVIPVVLIVIGYPIGAWMVENWLTIPPDRIEACRCVLRCVCVTCFIGMVSVPFRAMYGAKQYIAELTVYGVVQTACNVLFLYYMVTHPGTWLTRYAIWSCVLNSTPLLIISFRALSVFPECKIRASYFWNVPRFRGLFVFAAYRCGGALCGVLSQQGMTLLVNKQIGPAKNAAMSIGSTVAGYSQTFASSTSAAFYPAITNAAGEGDWDKMRRLSFVSCKLAAALVLIFAIPLLLEVQEVMVLWLKNPPEGAAIICSSLLLAAVLENITCGHYMTIFSVGKIRGYQICVSLCGVAVLPIAFAGMVCGWGLAGVGVALVVSNALCVIVRLYFAQVVGGLSATYWTCRVLLPLLVCSSIGILPGLLVVSWWNASFARVCATTCAIEIAFLPLLWFLLFGAEERAYVRNRAVRIFQRVGMR